MKNRIFYKVVRVVEGGFRSIYKANPQTYVLNQKINCPYMFVYMPGESMGELTEHRAANGEFALLKVRAECEPKMLLLEDVCEGIHGTVGNTLRFLKSRIVNGSGSCWAREYVLLDSLTPIGVVDLTKLNKSGDFNFLAPSEGEEDGQ